MAPTVYPHPAEQISCIETHISWVILTGPYAYKIKKPVNLGFLDFSTLEKRGFYCEEELRLNARWAPAIYLDVLPICGTPENPNLNAEGPVIEYAVKMRQFPQAAQLDKRLRAGLLGGVEIDVIAHMISKRQREAAVAGVDVPYGDPDTVYHPMLENFEGMRAWISGGPQEKQVAALETFTQRQFEALSPILARRKAEGRVRDGHGDLHLRNLAWIEGTPLAFDCIEFDPALRWIDTLSEAAFLTMDLQVNTEERLARRFINTYLEDCGDYRDLKVFRFYLVYRALVRAKVAAIRARQAAGPEHDAETREFSRYLDLATSYTRHASPRLILTRGVSASGKSTVTQSLLQLMNAIRIRSDVERKRLYGVAADADCGSAVGRGLYTSEASTRTYDVLLRDAAAILDAGYAVIVDAAFLSAKARRPFQQLAAEKGVPYVILELRAAAPTLRRRIQTRAKGVSDADLAVLEAQLDRWEPLDEAERPHCLRIDTEEKIAIPDLVDRIQKQH